MKRIWVVLLLFMFAAQSRALTTNEINAAHAQVKARYLQFLQGTSTTFDGSLGSEAASVFVSRINSRVAQVQAFDFTSDTNAVFSLYPGETGFEEEEEVYSKFLESWLPALAFGYTVDAPGNAHYLDSSIKDLYFQSLEYLYGRGVKTGMTFHRNATRELNNPPPAGCANIVDMELRMGSYCQAALLMEPHAAGEPIFSDALELVTFLEMLGRSSGHVYYWIPYDTPTNLPGLVQSDALQIYSDVTFVSAMLQTNVTRRAEMLADAQEVFTDSLKCIPGWADTIKPDFTGYHHRGIYGNSYTGGFMPQAAFGVYALQGTPYAVETNSVENLKQLALTYRLYSQKYAMPFGIRGRFPDVTEHIIGQAFGTYVIFASGLGLDDASMRPVFERLWDPSAVGMDFVFDGGRGKILRGMYAVDMAKELDARSIVPEPDPSGFWMKPYGGLAIHRRNGWMAGVKGFSKYIWDYENGGSTENVYGQYVSHGMLTIFANGSPVNDIDSGYDIQNGWDWYRQPGTTGVRFPIVGSPAAMEHRIFSAETFLGGVSVDEQNGLFGMVLDDPEFPDGTQMDLVAKKSVFFSDDLIVMLGTDISGGDGSHAVETTLFQSCHTSGSQTMKKNGVVFPDGSETIAASGSITLADPFGNGYYIPDAYGMKLFQGNQNSYHDHGTTASSGDYSTVVFDHGLAPSAETYEAAILVQGEGEIGTLAASASSYYQVQRMDGNVHQVFFPQANQTAYAFFGAVDNTNALVEWVDTPCLAMTEPTSNGWKISVANPDLGFVATAQEVTFDWINDSDERQYLPSTELPVDIRVQGLWELVGTLSDVSVVRYENGGTVLRFACIHGESIDAVLAPYGGATSPLEFTTVVFEDDFDLYVSDAALPTAGKWTSSSYFEASNVFVHVRTDAGGVFGEGPANQYLGMRDAGGKSSNLVAEDIVDARAVRLSFDFSEPDNGLTGSLSVRMGIDNVKISEDEVVGGIRPEDGILKPDSTPIPYGTKVHVDVFFNERVDAIEYIDPHGSPQMLASGKMDVWQDGNLVGNDVVNDRGIGTNTLSDIRSLRFETYSSPQQETWFDNLEIAIATPSSATSPYLVWAADYNLLGSDAELLANPDGDSLNNLAEYALGGVPTNGTVSSGILPVIGSIDASFFEYIHRRRTNATALGLAYIVERNTNLVSGTWTTNGVSETGFAPAETGFEIVTNEVPTDVEPHQYIRLKIKSM
ncbi:polysaccharide lyase family 8 super-sandwich domain-containing protein [Pontiella sulfatireligans]|uniref:Chondroitin sulfate ABC exolyase n=1 Tax=Pontiella sulfatireligans TaxID=2750658 RepID=A0A6C2UPV5_9BACT|nr:polysaccharide lyase family 8 super-sandwich domain-containing protein [Pontiella sulfatireligans]VGO22330.1 Chondroitin sulfate ABC exolyase [Pontiella sulfatireligans]